MGSFPRSIHRVARLDGFFDIMPNTAQDCLTASVAYHRLLYFPGVAILPVGARGGAFLYIIVFAGGSVLRFRKSSAVGGNAGRWLRSVEGPGGISGNLKWNVARTALG